MLSRAAEIGANLNWSGGQTRRGKSSAVGEGTSNERYGEVTHEAGTAARRADRLSGRRCLGLANVAYQAALTYRPTPDAVLAIAGALAPTLAILVAWWAPGRPLRLSMLVVAMLLELPALVIAGSALAFAVEVLLVIAVVAMQSHVNRRQKQRRLSIVF